MNLMQKSLTLLLLFTVFTGLSQDKLEDDKKEIVDNEKTNRIYIKLSIENRYT